MRRKPFGICAIAIFLTVAAVFDHLRSEAGGIAVMSIDEHGTFISVAMTAKDEVDACILENRQSELAHFHQFDFRVGIVRSLAVGRVMPERDNPRLGGACEI